jgi:putative glutathione S-transferase
MLATPPSPGHSYPCFAALDHWEAILERQRFLVGDALTLADIAMFPTLYRFDPVYVAHFKTNNRRIQDYPNLWGFVRDVHAHHGVAETCRLDQVKEHYYRSHPQLNPRGFVPPGPVIDYTVPTDRAERDWG